MLGSLVAAHLSQIPRPTVMRKISNLLIKSMLNGPPEEQRELTNDRLTREEREEMYKIARERIFGSSENSVNGMGLLKQSVFRYAYHFNRNRWR